MQRYLNLLYSIIVWSAIFIFIKPKRIKELLPVALIAAIVIAVQEAFLIPLDLHIFNNPFLPIGNVPFFHLVFGAGSGLFMMNYMKKEPSRKALILLLFAIVITFMAYISNLIACCNLLGKFTIVHNFYQNYLVLCFLTIISEAFLYKRLYRQ
ncbi:MAG: hypothetical protein BWY15_02144 [Firmicutes bacterium ADurb.Bin193]|nr:MAG: hypothetical protein BWY15_02144 [Firmicutes bacterium ADurb.Bin193]